MIRLQTWVCTHRRQLLQWSLVIVITAPFAAWLINRVFAVDAYTVVVVIGSIMFAMWRPYRDSWLRSRCRIRTQVCASH